MSHFHSENQNRSLRLTVRVKLLNLSQLSAPVEKTSRLGALIAQGEKNSKEPLQLATEAAPDRPKPGELCMADMRRVALEHFEEHIDQCAVCASRVGLQLDFMETLEAAVYQRLAEPESERVRGALLISAPKLNFAVCGELDLG